MLFEFPFGIDTSLSDWSAVCITNFRWSFLPLLDYETENSPIWLYQDNGSMRTNDKISQLDRHSCFVVYFFSSSNFIFFALEKDYQQSHEIKWEFDVKQQEMITIEKSSRESINCWLLFFFSSSEVLMKVCEIFHIWTMRLCSYYQTQNVTSDFICS